MLLTILKPFNSLFTENGIYGILEVGEKELVSPQIGWAAVPAPGKDLSGMPTEAQSFNLAASLSPKLLWKAWGEGRERQCGRVHGGILRIASNCFNRFLKPRGSYRCTNPTETQASFF